MNIIHGECVAVMTEMAAESVDAVVCDPPYGLEFMGKAWDRLGRPDWAAHKASGRHGGGTDPFTTHMTTYQGGTPAQAFHAAWAEAAYRVAKPSAYLLAFGGTRTVHRMTVALEDAGWIIRDMLVWAYASGFPKSKASLKPAWEPIVMARKPGPLRMLAIDSCRIPGQWTTWRKADGSINHEQDTATSYAWDGERQEHPAGRWPANVILTDELFEPGVPGVVIAGSLTGTMTAWSSSPDSAPNPTDSPANNAAARSSRGVPGVSFPASATEPAGTQLDAWGTSTDTPKPDTGCSDGTMADDPATSGSTDGSGAKPTELSRPGASSITATATDSTTDSTISNSSPEPSTIGTIRPSRPESSRLDEPRARGTFDDLSDDSANWRRNSPSAEEQPSLGYSRFFLVPKADRGDREPVLGGPTKVRAILGQGIGGADNLGVARANHHPTVKPTELMRHLVRLVTPAGGTVLDPFLGSGTTGIACELEGFPWIGIEKEAEYVAIAEARLNGTQRGFGLVG